MVTNSEKRAQQLRQQQTATEGQEPLDTEKQPSWRASFDRKQVVTVIVSAVAGAVFVLIGMIVSGVWSMYSENWENRLVKKVG